jgi:hypothetical protein
VFAEASRCALPLLTSGQALFVYRVLQLVRRRVAGETVVVTRLWRVIDCRVVNARRSGSLLSLLLACSTLLHSVCGDYDIIAPASTWQYDDSGADNIAMGFEGDDFDASSWRSGKGPLGYGDGDEATVLSGGPGVCCDLMMMMLRWWWWSSSSSWSWSWSVMLLLLLPLVLLFILMLTMMMWLRCCSDDPTAVRSCLLQTRHGSTSRTTSARS